MGDVGDFWRDVHAARKDAGMPARRRKRHAEPPSKRDMREFAALGFEQKSEWHWQMRLAGELLDFWPSKCKWMYRGAVKTGDWGILFALIAEKKAGNDATIKGKQL